MKRRIRLDVRIGSLAIRYVIITPPSLLAETQCADLARLAPIKPSYWPRPTETLTHQLGTHIPQSLPAQHREHSHARESSAALTHTPLTQTYREYPRRASRGDYERYAESSTDAPVHHAGSAHYADVAPSAQHTNPAVYSQQHEELYGNRVGPQQGVPLEYNQPIPDSSIFDHTRYSSSPAYESSDDGEPSDVEEYHYDNQDMYYGSPLRSPYLQDGNGRGGYNYDLNEGYEFFPQEFDVVEADGSPGYSWNQGYYRDQYQGSAYGPFYPDETANTGGNDPAYVSSYPHYQQPQSDGRYDGSGFY